MTVFRPFRRADMPPTLFGLAFGAFYGAMTIALINVWGSGILLLLLLGLPFIAVQLIVHIALNRFARWRRTETPPAPPNAWARHHSVSIGAATGATALLLVFLLQGLAYGAAP